MSNYRYVFSTLRTEQVVEEIDLYGVYMDMEMNQGGTLTGTFQLDQTGKRNQDLISATTPGRTYIVVERNNVPIWAGIIGSRVYQSQSKSCQLSATSFEHYPDRQRIDSDITISNTEQRTIFKTLWTTMQSLAERNLNINVPVTSYPDAVLKSVAVLGTDKKYFGEEMSNLADADDGFDWYISISKNGNLYNKAINIGYPTLGIPYNTESIVLEYPGTILNYYMTESMNESATNVNVNGSGEGTTMILGNFENTAMYAQGWPRWDLDISRKDMATSSQATGIAAQEGANRRPPMIVVKTTLKSNQYPEFGSFGLGDGVKIVIKDARNEDVYTTTTRMLRWELTPQSSQASEEVNYVFAGDPDVG